MARFSAYFTLIGLGLLLAAQANADILFIDLNGSATEIAAARKAANARGEKLVVLPKRTPRQQKIYAQIHDLQLNRERAEGARRQQMNDEILKLYKEASPPAFSMAELQSTLKTYAQSGGSFETVIISGHHGGRRFFGQFGSIEDESSVAQAFSKYPRLLSAVHSYYGWGCYTNTVEEAMAWQSSFPELRVTGGFDGAAPGPETPADSGFLAAILAKESLLDKISEKESTKQEMDQVARMVRAIGDFNQTNASVCTCDECVGKNTGDVSLQQLQGCDATVITQMQKSMYTALSGPYQPCDTQNSPLRSYYDLLRQKSYCAGKIEDFRVYTAQADGILRMIYLPQVLKNFDLYYAEEIRQVSAVVKACDPKAQFPDFTAPVGCDPPDHNPPHAISRNDLQSASFALDSAEYTAACTSNPKNAALLKRFSCHLDGLYSVPASWVDPVDNATQLDHPSDRCNAPGGMGFLGGLGGLL